MTREDIEKCMSYHAAGEALGYYKQQYFQPRMIESKDVVDAFEETNKYPHHFGVIITDDKGQTLEIGGKMFDTYELALEDAIKYALENLV